MNRIIKFRAWHKYGNLEMNTPGMTYDELPGDCLLWKNQGQDITEIMQFTGLTDKNGKEIYEGDVIEWPHLKDSPQYVYWNNKESCFALKDNVGGCESWLIGADEKAEIIGNIHANPELMEE